jgi:hypothetical protein
MNLIYGLMDLSLEMLKKEFGLGGGNLRRYEFRLPFHEYELPFDEHGLCFDVYKIPFDECRLPLDEYGLPLVF